MGGRETSSGGQGFESLNRAVSAPASKTAALSFGTPSRASVTDCGFAFCSIVHTEVMFKSAHRGEAHEEQERRPFGYEIGGIANRGGERVLGGSFQSRMTTFRSEL